MNRNRLEDLGYGRPPIIRRLRYLPLDPFRTVLHYTNFGVTPGALAVAAAVGTDWATLSERDIHQPLGMTHTGLHVDSGGRERPRRRHLKGHLRPGRARPGYRRDHRTLRPRRDGHVPQVSSVRTL